MQNLGSHQATAGAGDTSEIKYLLRSLPRMVPKQEPPNSFMLVDHMMLHEDSLLLLICFCPHFLDGANEAQSYHLVITRYNWKRPER